jgi:hypothetical protein
MCIKQKLEDLRLKLNNEFINDTIKFLFNKELDIMLKFDEKHIINIIKSGELDYYNKYLTEKGRKIYLLFI